MVKSRKEKFLVSLVIIALVVLVIGNVRSLATAPKITANTNSTGNTNALSTNNATNTGATDSVSAAVNNSTKNTNSNSNSNKTANNTNKTSNTNSSNSSKLPYAGTNGTVVFVVIALAASAIYAYKKVSDYNV